MVSKKRAAELKSLLDWEQEKDRLPRTRKLINIQIGDNIFLREDMDKIWSINYFEEIENGFTVKQIGLKHETLIQLGLAIMESVKHTEDRWLNNK